MAKRLPIWTLILTAAVCFPMAGAAQSQDQGSQTGAAASAGSGQEQGTAAGQTGASATTANPNQAPQEGQTPATGGGEGALTGVEQFSPGQVGGMRSYFIPSFQISEMADSNYGISSGAQRFEAVSSVVGRLSMQRVGRHSRITADYLGGGEFYTNHSELNTTMHQFGITQVLTGRRWSFLLDDRATYLPESAFGYGGFGWSGSLGTSLGGAFGSNLTGLNGYFNPASSLLTSRGSRILNTVSTQISYRTGPRSTFTLAGSYGILHFRNGGFNNSRNTYFQAGFTRAMTARDDIGISYGFSLFQFSAGTTSFQTHYLQLTYGHRISGRMSASFGGGVQVGVFKSATAGSTTPVSWTGNGSLNYRARLANLSLSYYRYTTNGGGLLTGATTDYVQLGVNKGLGRNWSVSLTPGFSRNRSLPQNTAAGQERTYDAATASATLSRNLGRYMSMYFGYTFQSQTNTVAACGTGNCGTSLHRQLLSFGFDWHPRQFFVN